MNYKKSFKNSLETSWIVIKLVIPIYLLAEVLYYYNLLAYFAPIFEPIASILDLPSETVLAIISGMFLNLYAAIAFAAPLDLTPKEWTVFGVYLGICHSLIVEGAITKKLGVSLLYSYTLRITAGLAVGYLTTLLPDSFFSAEVVKTVFESKVYENIFELLKVSLLNAVTLTIKVICIITILIFIMNYIKNLSILKESKKNVSKGFSLIVGGFLGITYGAGILIEESKSGSMSKADIFYVTTFLLICHAIIEDTLLFALFGANMTLLIVIRTLSAFVIAYVLLKVFSKKLK